MNVMGMHVIPANRKHLYNIYTTSAQYFDVGPTLCKCYTKKVCFLGNIAWSGLKDAWVQSGAAGLDKSGKAIALQLTIQAMGSRLTLALLS